MRGGQGEQSSEIGVLEGTAAKDGGQGYFGRVASEEVMGSSRFK